MPIARIVIIVVAAFAAGVLVIPPVRAFAVNAGTNAVDNASAEVEIARVNVSAQENETKVAADIAKAYNVPVSQITQLHASRWGYGEIEMMYALAKASGKTPAEIQAMRQSGLGWGEIAHRLHMSLGHIQHLGRIVFK
jgi:hypothetical protein